MKRNLQLFALIVLSACSGKQEKVANETSMDEPMINETISPVAFQQKLEETAGAIIVDLRTPPELEAGYLEGSTNIDFKAADFQSKIDQLDKSKPYFVYCAGGGRSGKTAEIMRGMKFKKVYNLDGGFGAWKDQGLPIVQKNE